MAESAWYKQGWPWVIISIPLSAVVFGILMLVVAGRYPDDLVADEYYRDGMAINEQLTRDNNAAVQGVRVRLSNIVGNHVSFRISNVRDSAVMLSVYHVVDRDKDRNIALYPDGDGGEYSIDDAYLAQLFNMQGVWYLEFQGVDDDWRLQSRVEMPIENLELE